MNKLFTVILVFCIGSKALAADPEVKKNINFLSFRQIDFENTWVHSGNAAGLSQLSDLFSSEIKLNVGQADGAFHSAFTGQSRQDYDFSSQSYLKINKAFLYGSFDYNRSIEKGLNYTNTNDPIQNYPYLLADTIGNDDCSREFFEMKGGLAVPVTEKLIGGLGFSYNVGIAGQNRDPRAENKVMNLKFSPGFIYRGHHFKIGANLDYGYYNEDIDISVVAEGIQVTTFQTDGLGVYKYHSSTSFSRIYKQQQAGVGLQLELRKNSISNLLYSNYLYLGQTIDDGRKGSIATWAAVKNDSKIDGIRWNITDEFSLQRGNRIQQLKVTFGLGNRLGTEFIQQLEKVDNVNTERWVTYGQSGRYYSLETNSLMSYSLMTKDENNSIASLFCAAVGYRTFAEKYYYPNLKAEFSNLSFNSSFLKLFRMQKALISAEVRAEYHLNTDKSQNMDQENFIVQKIYMPQLSYLTKDYISPGFTAGYQLPVKKLQGKWFVNASFDWFSAIGGQSRNVFSFSTGLTF